jgi:lantibiotic biosynthesis protein
MFQTADAVLIRAAAYPRDLALPAWPDLTTNQPEVWLKWLDEVWALPGFADAVTLAAPQLTAQITRALAGEPLAEHRIRRLTVR